MIFKVAGILFFLSVCGIVALNPDKPVDCRKFVFAPLCRGVAAKRGTVDASLKGEDTYTNDEKYLLRNLYAAISRLGTPEDYDQRGELVYKQNKESPWKMNQRNRLLKLIFDGRTPNSEKDNFSELELENF